MIATYSPATAAALQLHDAGLVVIPIPPGEKSPRTKGWPSQRLSQEQIVAHYERYPDHNIGVLEGPAGGVIELDCDGPDAEQKVLELFGSEPPKTLACQATRGIKRFFRWDDRFQSLAATFKDGDLEYRIGTSACQSLVYGTVAEHDHSRTFDLSHGIAALPDAIVEKIIAAAPKRGTNAVSDDLFADLHDALQQAAIGQHMTWCARHGLKITHQHSDKGNVYLHLRTPCPFKVAGDSDGDPCIMVSIDGTAHWACRHAKCANKTIADLYAIGAPKEKTGLTSFTAAELLATPDPPIESVVEGFIARGDVASLIAPPKKRKSWAVMQLACSVASGRPFLGMATSKGRVRCYDNELRVSTIRRRLRQVAKAMGLTKADLENIEFVPLKGKHLTFDDVRKDLQAQAGDYQLVILDASYKFLAKGVDENSNGDMAQQYAILDSIAEESECALVLVHHASKGSQRGKANTDIGAGAGAQARSVDVHATIIEHPDEPGIFVLSADVRNFAPFKPICIHHAHPLWQLAPDYTPDGRRPPTIAEFVSTIPVEPSRKAATLKASREALGITIAECDVLLQAAIDAGSIVLTIPTKPTDPHTIHRRP